MKSSKPRSAFTALPSGPRIESGTPKKARKYNEAVSKSIILRERTPEYWHDSPHGEARPSYSLAPRARRPDVLYGHRQGDRPVHIGCPATGSSPGAAWRDQGLHRQT